MIVTIQCEHLRDNCSHLTNYQKIVLNYYLDYVNNYLTTSKIADDNGLSYGLSDKLILEGRKILESLNQNKGSGE